VKKELVMKLRWMLLVPAAAVLLAAASGAAPVREQERIVEKYQTGSQPTLGLKNVNGDVVLEGWDENRIEVTAVKYASSKERLEDVEITFHMDDDRLRIEVDPDGGDRWPSRHGSVGVDFEIHAPRGTKVDAIEVVNGGVKIRGIEGDVDVSSVNGGVSGEDLGGDVDLATVNGGVSLVAGGGADSIRLHSVNGGVLLVLPKKFDARIQAGTVHGTIRADGEADATSFTGTSMSATLGKGGMKVDLNTVNGSIEIRRRGESGAREKD
jgi:DUF4097 and DUF4098 domain-containing protein YvlB